MTPLEDLPLAALERITSAPQARLMFERLTAWAKAKGVEPSAQPKEPQTCCARGCQGCVWLGFFEAAHHWRERTLLALGLDADFIRFMSSKASQSSAPRGESSLS